MKKIDALLEHRPFIEALARRMVSDQNEADDIVQDTWMVVINRPPGRITNVRGWLRSVVRSQALNRVRGRRAQIHHESAARSEGVAPSAQEEAVLRSIRHNLHSALTDLDGPYREVIVLRFLEGLPPREIAKQMGTPVETVRTRTRRALAQLRGRLDETTDGGRGAWTVLFAGWIERQRPFVPLTSGTGFGVGWAALIGTLSTLALVFWMLPAIPSSVESATPASPPTGAQVSARPIEDTEGDSNRASLGAAESLDPAPALGGLRVTLSWSDTGTPASGIKLKLHESNGRGSQAEYEMDEGGRLSIDELLPGQWTISTEFSGRRTVTVRAGHITDFSWTLERGRRLSGIARYITGAPAVGATVFASFPGDPSGLREVATSGPAGWFETIPLADDVWIGARKGTTQFNLIHFDRARHRPGQELDLVLPKRTERQVTLTVLDNLGEPLEGAEITLMSRQTGLTLFAPDGTLWKNTVPDRHTTDSNGVLFLESVESAQTAIVVRAPGHAPAKLSTTRTTDPSAKLTVRLEVGAVIEGVVTADDGSAIPGARITADLGSEFGSRNVFSDSRGRFRMTELPEGHIPMQAMGMEGSGAMGAARTRLEVTTGAATSWEPVLDEEQSIRGRVLLPSGSPATGWHGSIYPKPISSKSTTAHCLGSNAEGWSGSTDSQGQFAFSAPPGQYILRFWKPDSTGSIPDAWLLDAEPGGTEVEIRARNTELDSVLSGFLVDADGSPALDTEVLLTSPVLERPIRFPAEAATGYFESQPLPPILVDVGAWPTGVAPTPELVQVQLRPDDALELDPIVVPKAGSLTIHILDPDGEGLTRWSSIRLAGEDTVVVNGRVPSSRHFAVVDGSIEIPRIRAGIYDFRVQTRPYLSFRERLHIAPGEEHVFTAQLEWADKGAFLLAELPWSETARTELAISVRDENGREVHSTNIGLAPVLTEGQFGVSGLKPGTYLVHGYATAGTDLSSCGEQEIRIPSDSTRSDRIPLKLEACGAASGCDH